MALVIKDRVKETTTTTGTGTINLAGAASGFQSFVSGVGDGNTTYYVIEDANGTAWEVGIGTITDASPDTLARTTVLASTNSNSQINLSSGTHTVFGTYPAGKAVYLDASGNLSHTVALTTDTSGNYVATITGGTGITSTGATSGEGIAHSLSVDASQTQITAVGTIATGTWQGTAIAQAYIANDAINGDKIADDAVNSEHYAAGSIDEEHLNATNTPTDNYVLSYDDASGGFTWVAAGAGEANEYSFKTISVSGQDDVVADTTTDTLTLTAGSNVTITTTAASDTVTIAATDTNTQLSQEQVEDFVGGMLGGTETLITVTYQDGTGDIDFVVDNDLSNYDNSSSGFITATLTEEQVEDFVGGMLGGTETGITVTYQDGTGDIDFVVSDTTVAGDSGSTGITPGDTLTIAGGTNVTTAMSGDTLTITATDNNTTYTGGTNLTLDGTTFNVDDAFLKNDASDSTTGTITAGGFTTAGTLTVDSVGISTIQSSGESFADNDTSLMTSAAIDDRINSAVANEDTLAELNDTNISSAAAGHLIIYDNTASVWDNAALTAGSNISITNGDGSITIAATDTNTQLTTEQVEDIVGGMVAGNTETGITVTYEDGDGTLDFVVGTLNQDTTGNAATATALETARTINGTSFDGTANITITAAGSTLSDTVTVAKGGTGATSLTDGGILLGSGTDAITATAVLANGELLIGDNSTDPTVATLTAGSNVTITNGAGSITIASTDTNTQLTTEQVQDIAGGMFSSNTETLITATYQDADGTVDLVVDNDLSNYDNSSSGFITATLTTEQVQDIVGGMVTGNTETGIAVTYEDGDGTLDFVVGTLNQDTTGNAATATALETARTINGTSFDGTANITVTAAGSTLSDTVTVAKGGTGQTSYTNGQLLIGNTTGNTLAKSTLTAGSNVTITNGTGSITIAADNDNTQLSEEQVEDFVGGMVTGNTETGIAVTYEDGDGTLDFVVSDTTVAGDSGSTGITPGDTLTIAGGTNATTAMSGDTLTVNVDDAFLKNNADDTTSGTVTMANLIIGDGGNIGSASDTDAVAISAGGVVTLATALKTTLKSNTDASTVTFDLNVANTHTVTLGDNRTLAISNETAGQKFIINLVQDGTGSRTVTWFGTIKWAGGSAPTLTTTADKADSFGFLCTGSDAYYGFVIGQNI